MLITVLLILLLIVDAAITLILYKEYQRYKNALEQIASGLVPFSKSVSVALKALKNVKD